jgi:hypothetical protein
MNMDGEEECWECGGEGYTYMCQDEIGCVDPESGCDLCRRRCWVCNSKPTRTTMENGDGTNGPAL